MSITTSASSGFHSLANSVHFPAPTNPPDGRAMLTELSRPHIDSFNFMLRDGLRLACQHIAPVEFSLQNGEQIRFSISDATIKPPQISHASLSRVSEIYPSECRQRGTTYRGRLLVDLTWSLDGTSSGGERVCVGEVPIMLRSEACNLSKLKTPDEMIAKGEDALEMGGYFIINGIEKLIRMTVIQRRHFPMAFVRPSWKNRGRNYSEFGIFLRCVRADQTTTCLMDATDFNFYTQALAGQLESDSYFRTCVMGMLRELQSQGLRTRQQALEYVGRMFRVKFALPDFYTDAQVAEYLLKQFVCVHLDSSFDKVNLLMFMLRKLFALARGECVADNPDSPAHWEALLPGHLYLFKLKELLETWLSTIKRVLVKQLTEGVKGGRKSGGTAASAAEQQAPLTSNALTRAIATATDTVGVGRALEYLLATGNVLTRTGLGIQQLTGMSTVAERINMQRFLAHFRSIHRGSFFTEMRSTSGRKLLPEAWGFICPVHTPDGSPCGLLNHLTATCQVENVLHDTSGLFDVLCSLGLVPISEPALHSLLVPPPDARAEPARSSVSPGGEQTPGDELLSREDAGTTSHSYAYPVLLDGRMMGVVPKELAPRMAAELRSLKVGKKVPKTLEICFMPLLEASSGADATSAAGGTGADGGVTRLPGQYPGLFLFAGPARLVRPVVNLAHDKLEWIGLLEQVYLAVAVEQADIDRSADSGLDEPAAGERPGLLRSYTHRELAASHSMLSVLANLIPFPDFNQSPRNMYQCQMGKQSLGTPCHSFDRRADTKLYRLFTQQQPIVRTAAYDQFNMNHYPQGLNAVVAVISYTGYDMEDAMIINKASHDRGIFDACIYKTEKVDLEDVAKESHERPGAFVFRYKMGTFGANSAARDRHYSNYLGADGLPHIGVYLTEDSPFYSYVDTQTGVMRIEKYKSSEAATVEQVLLLGGETGRLPLVCAAIKVRVSRRPQIGDKFASRHGQKGVLSQLWPAENMPFSASGLTPDILFNPHGFPSRMTIGMIIEAMAGKSGALKGISHDATPFKFDEKNAAAEYFGKLLVDCGFSWYGTERLYSGVYGNEFEANIFMGVIYYQRLRHMVADKFQVRTTGPVDQLTQQPVKGRKRAGGIRLGEMERDALLAHGASFFLHDRLFNCSDKSMAHVCSGCGSILGTCLAPRTPRPGCETLVSASVSSNAVGQQRQLSCRSCAADGAVGGLQTSRPVVTVPLPYVTRYLVNELAAANIHLRFDTQSFSSAAVAKI